MGWSQQVEFLLLILVVLRGDRQSGHSPLSVN